MTRVIVIGLGPIGLACAAATIEAPGLVLVGLVDIDPKKIGKSASELLGMEVPGEDPVVVSSLDAVPVDANAAIVTTSSHFDAVVPTLRACMEKKLCVVSSCEQMLYPWLRHPELANAIDDEAQAAGVALLGTGVNPGFVMDTLAVVMSSMVAAVRKVRCVRVVDASTRRQPLQAKVGATMSVDEFSALARASKIGHKGLGESVALLAAGLGQRAMLDQISETLEPVVADRRLDSALGAIEPGRVRGIHNVGIWKNELLEITLDLTMAVGEADPRDEITLDGPVPLHVKVVGGTPGDTATVASMINQTRQIRVVPAGLRTMLDMPPAGARA